MEINKRSRAELKQYFVKNAIPTEKNFAELIDGMLSQKDDGIAKLPGNPLSIEAAGEDASQKKAIHFYTRLADADPTWVLSLNPRQDPAKPETAKPGFSIGDSAGNSRLFIDRDTGRVGLGTITPRGNLDVPQGDVYVGKTLNISAPSNNYDGGVLNIINETNKKFWHIDIRSNEADKLIFWRNDGSSNAWLAALKLGMDGTVEAPGPVKTGGYTERTASVNGYSLEVGGLDPTSTNGRATIFLHHHNKIAHQLRYASGTLYLEAAGNEYGTSPRPTLALGGDVSLEGKLAFRGNDSWLRLNQDGQFASGVYTPGILRVDGGAEIQSIGIGTQLHGATTYPYETIQMAPGHNLRIWFGTDQMFIFQNTGALTIKGSLSVGGDVSITGSLEMNGHAKLGRETAINDFGAMLESGFYSNGGSRATGDVPDTSHRWTHLITARHIHGNNFQLQIAASFAMNDRLFFRKIGADTAYNSPWNEVATRTDSDIKLKRDVKPIEGVLDKLLSLRGISFFWRDELRGTARQLGVLAHEVEAVFPELVSSFDDTHRLVHYEKFAPVLIEALKEQQAQIQRLQEQVRALGGPELEKR